MKSDIEAVFGISNIDFNISENYYPETGKFKIPWVNLARYESNGTISYQNNEWILTEKIYNDKMMKIVLNSDFTVKKVETIYLCEHSYKIISQIEGNCEQNGYVFSVCQKCGEYKTEEYLAAGHKNVFAHQAPATALEPAKNVYRCEACGEESYKYFGFAKCDLDENGIIDERDYTVFESSVDSLDTECFDFNSDGKIDEFDKVIVKLITKGVSFDEMIDITGDGQSDVRDLIRMKKLMTANEDDPLCNRNGDDETNSADLVFTAEFLLFFDKSLLVNA